MLSLSRIEKRAEARPVRAMLWSPAMTSKQSAGLMAYRRRRGTVEVLLVHPGGPFWKNKDEGAWSIPKGEFGDGEDALIAARREFEEETGFAVEGPFTPLGSAKQKSGKTAHAWAVEAQVDAAAIRSNTFSMEWPPKSGRMQEFPEVDRAEWFSLEKARVKINAGQAGFLDRLAKALENPGA
jgi:predicted NUDIX family NTP pyrophosphohydrolase